MAPALVGTRRKSANRVRTRTWRAANTSIAEVLKTLTSLHADLARRDWTGPDGDQPHPRNIVVTLIVVADNEENAKRAAVIAERMAFQHPSRSVVVLIVPGRRGRIDATVTSHAHVLVAGSPVQFEHVFLRARGALTKHLGSLVAPLLVSDVPTLFWWMGTPPLSGPELFQPLELADLLVVDSAEFDRPFESLLELAKIAQALQPRIGVADFHWARLHAWREMVAQFFTPVERRSFLKGLNGVGIDYAGEGRGNRTAACLLAGWLISNLGWTLRRAAAGQGGTLAAYLDAPGQHGVQIAFRSVSAEELQPGELSAIRLEGASGGRTCAFAIERDPEERDRVIVKIDIGGVETLQQSLPMDNPDQAELLLRVVAAGRRDPVYLRALESAAALMQATR